MLGVVLKLQQLNDWMRSIGMGGGERVGGYYRNSWQGLTKVNTKNMTPLDPLLNFEVITSGVGSVSFGGGAGLIGSVYAYTIGGQSAMNTFTFNPNETAANSGARVRSMFKKYGINVPVGEGIGIRYWDNSRGRPHHGLDFPVNAPGYSPFAYAETTFKASTKGYGGTMEVFELDANGNRTGNSVFFAHLDGRSSKYGGKRVKYGDIVSLSGNTGYSKGVHHHIEFRYYDSTGKMTRRSNIAEGEIIAVVAAPKVQLVRKGGAPNANNSALQTQIGVKAPSFIKARVTESKVVKDWKAGNSAPLNTLYLSSGHSVDVLTGTPGAGETAPFKYAGRVRTMESAMNIASRELIYKYLVGMGFNVKLVDPLPSEITSSSDANVQTAARTKYYNRIRSIEAGGNQVVEIHYDQWTTAGRSGVIPPIDNASISMLDAALAESYGKFSQLHRGKDGLATTRRGMTILELGAANSGVVNAFKNYLKGNTAEFEAFMKWHATQIGNAMIKSKASRKVSSATQSTGPTDGFKSASTYEPDKSVASKIQPNSVESTVQAKAEIIYGLDKDINITAMNVSNPEAVNADGVAIKAPVNSTTVAKAPKPSVRVIKDPIDTNVIAAIPNKKVTVAVTKSDGSTEVNSAVPMDVRYQEMFINSTTIFNPDYMGLDPSLDYMILSGQVFV